MKNTIKNFDAEINELLNAMKSEIIKHLVTPETNGVFFWGDDFHTLVEGPDESTDEPACAYYVHDNKIYARHKPVLINDFECDYNYACKDGDCYDLSF